MSLVMVEEQYLKDIANAIRKQESKVQGYELNKDNWPLAPKNMADGIKVLQLYAIPASAFCLTGSLEKKFANGENSWMLNYQDMIVTEDITNLKNAFSNNKSVKVINFDLNCKKDTSIKLDGLFDGCENLEHINGDIKNATVSDISGIFRGCYRLVTLPNFVDIDWSSLQSYKYAYANQMFYKCYSLRVIPKGYIKDVYSLATTASYQVYSNTFNLCYVLEEIDGLVVVPTENNNNYLFNATFHECSRLSKMRFNTNEDGTPLTAKMASLTIQLDYYVGFAWNKERIISYNSGITADKEVTDDATYQALKNDPDWFTCKEEYSRYNRLSAIETIASLPDTSAYIAEVGGNTNTVKFRGVAGKKTDGGAINTMTEEEIAVATAKGWTVAYV